jgi:hypothetical protein
MDAGLAVHPRRTHGADGHSDLVVKPLDLEQIDKMLKWYATKADELNDFGMGGDRAFVIDELLDERIKINKSVDQDQQGSRRIIS